MCPEPENDPTTTPQDNTPIDFDEILKGANQYNSGQYPTPSAKQGNPVNQGTTTNATPTTKKFGSGGGVVSNATQSSNNGYKPTWFKTTPVVEAVPIKPQPGISSSFPAAQTNLDASKFSMPNEKELEVISDKGFVTVKGDRIAVTGDAAQIINQGDIKNTEASNDRIITDFEKIVVNYGVGDDAFQRFTDYLIRTQKMSEEDAENLSNITFAKINSPELVTLGKPTTAQQANLNVEEQTIFAMADYLEQLDKKLTKLDHTGANTLGQAKQQEVKTYQKQEFTPGVYNSKYMTIGKVREMIDIIPAMGDASSMDAITMAKIHAYDRIDQLNIDQETKDKYKKLAENKIGTMDPLLATEWVLRDRLIEIQTFLGSGGDMTTEEMLANPGLFDQRAKEAGINNGQELFDELTNIDTGLKQIKKTRQIQGAPKKGEESVGDFFKYFKDNGLEVLADASTLGLYGLGQTFDLKHLIERGSSKDATSSDKASLMAYMFRDEMQKNTQLSWVYNTGGAVGEALPFMLTFVVGGGIAKSLSAGTTKYMIKQAGKITTKILPRVVGTLTKASIEGLFYTAVSPAFLESYAQRQMEGIEFKTGANGSIIADFSKVESPIRSAYVAGANTFLEFMTEGTGELFTAGLGKVSGAIRKRITGNLVNKSKKELAIIIASAKKRMRWNGLLGEYGEELLNGIAAPILTGEGNIADFFEKENQYTLITSIALMDGTFKVAEASEKGRSMYLQAKNKRNFENSAESLIKALGTEDAHELMTILTIDNPDTREQKLKDKGFITPESTIDINAGNKIDSPEKANAVIKFISASTNYQISSDFETEKGKKDIVKIINKESGNIIVGEDADGNRCFIVRKSMGSLMVVDIETGKPRWTAASSIKTISETPAETFIKENIKAQETELGEQIEKEETQENPAETLPQQPTEQQPTTEQAAPYIPTLRDRHTIDGAEYRITSLADGMAQLAPVNNPDGTAKSLTIPQQQLVDMVSAQQQPATETPVSTEGTPVSTEGAPVSTEARAPIKRALESSDGKTKIPFTIDSDNNAVSDVTFPTIEKAQKQADALGEAYSGKLEFSVENISDQNDPYSPNKFQITSKPVQKISQDAPQAREITEQKRRLDGLNALLAASTKNSAGAISLQEQITETENRIVELENEASNPQFKGQAPPVVQAEPVIEQAPTERPVTAPSQVNVPVQQTEPVVEQKKTPAVEQKPIAETSTPEVIAQQEAQTESTPSDKQKESGNFKKGRIKVQGLNIVIETAKGDTRSSKTTDSNQWSVTMNNSYGYFERSKGKDGDQVDVFIGNNPENKTVYVIDQLDNNGKFDEHKVMIGFNSEEEAVAAYNSNYSPGWAGLGAVTAMEIDHFKQWLGDRKRSKLPLAYMPSVDQATSEEAYIDHVIAYSADPAVIYQAWVMESERLPYNTMQPWQQALADGGYKTTQKSFTAVNDKNNVTGGLARMFFSSKKGSPLDSIAMALEMEGSQENMEKIADFMLYLSTNNPKNSARRIALAEKFRTITGVWPSQYAKLADKTNLDVIENFLKRYTTDKSMDLLSRLESIKNEINEGSYEATRQLIIDSRNGQIEKPLFQPTESRTNQHESSEQDQGNGSNDPAARQRGEGLENGESEDLDIDNASQPFHATDDLSPQSRQRIAQIDMELAAGEARVTAAIKARDKHASEIQNRVNLFGVDQQAPKNQVSMFDEVEADTTSENFSAIMAPYQNRVNDAKAYVENLKKIRAEIIETDGNNLTLFRMGKVSEILADAQHDIEWFRMCKVEAEAFAKALNIPVRLSTNPAGWSKAMQRELAKAKRFKASFAADAYYDSKKKEVVIIPGNVKSLDDIKMLIIHEGIGHHGMRQLFGPKYDKLLAQVYAGMSEAERQSIIGKNKKYYEDKPLTTIADEFLAYSLEPLMNGSAPAWLQTIWAEIKQMLRDLFTSWNIPFTETDIRVLGEKSKQNLIRQGAQHNTETGSTMFSMAGEVAMKNMDEGIVIEQKKIEAAQYDAIGMDASQIKLITNWEKGPDGKWFYEFSDRNFQIKELIGITATESAYLHDDGSALHGVLSDIVIAPEHYKAYPQLKDIKITTEKYSRSVKGGYFKELNTIVINSNHKWNATELRHTILHEVQHAIQGIEGFEPGASLSIRTETLEDINHESALLFEKYKDLSKWKNRNIEGRDEKLAEVTKKLRQLGAIRQRLTYDLSDNDAYRVKLGEVNARNVVFRDELRDTFMNKLVANGTPLGEAADKADLLVMGQPFSATSTMPGMQFPVAMESTLYLNAIAETGSLAMDSNIDVEGSVLFHAKKIKDPVKTDVIKVDGKNLPTKTSKGTIIHASEGGVINFWKWFDGSKVVDERGRPVVNYSGHSNAEMYGDKFNPKRSTAGGFYATEDPAIASNYSTSKFGSKEFFENGSQYKIKGKNGKHIKSLWQVELTDEQKKKMDELENMVDAQGEHLHQIHNMRQWAESNKNYDPVARKLSYRPYDLQSIWEYNEAMGYNIAYDNRKTDKDEPHFILQTKNETEILMDNLGIEWNSYEWAAPAVMPVFLNIRRPIDADKPFPTDVLAALKESAKREKKQSDSEISYNHWTSEYPLREFIADIERGSESWSTQVPKKALKVFKAFGYDGIKERGAKGSNAPRSERQINWIAFDANQIKSATGNTGEFNPEKAEVMFSAKYTPEGGEQLNIFSMNSAVESAKKSKTSPARKSETNPSLRSLQEGEMALIERKYRLNKNFAFTSPSRVESIQDVAYIFKQLEDQSVENSFAVYVKDGKATVQHLAIGSYGMTVAPLEVMSDAVSRFNPDEIYFIHNHPSGNLNASTPDINIAIKLAKIYGDKFKGALIINLKSGQFANIDYKKSVSEILSHNETDPAEVKLPVISFNRQVFSEDYDPSTIWKIRSSNDVAAFISSQRLGKRDKISVLVLRQNNDVVANIFTPFTLLDAEKNQIAAANEIAAIVTRFGGTGAIMYGRVGDKSKRKSVYEKIKDRLNISNIQLMDALWIETDNHAHSEEGNSVSGDAMFHASTATPLAQIEIQEISAKTDKYFEDWDNSMANGLIPRDVVSMKASPILSHIFSLDHDIRISRSVLDRKSKQGNHPYSPKDLKGIVNAMQDPLLISTHNSGSINILTDVLIDGCPIVVAIEKRKLLGANNMPYVAYDVKTIFPKNNGPILSHNDTGVIYIAESLEKQNRLKKIVAQRPVSSYWNTKDVSDISKIINNAAEVNQNFYNNIHLTEGGESSFHASTSMVAPKTYQSTVETALSKINQNKALPAQWKAMLINSGAKPAEMDWMGWDEHFADTSKVYSRGAVQQWINDNKVEIEDVEMGNYSNRDLEMVKVAPFLYNVVDTKDNSVVLAEVSENAAGEFIDNAHDGTNTRYAEYQLPGGKNYRELLLTMPGKPIKYDDITELPFDYEHITNKEKWGVIPIDQAHARPFSGLHDTKEEATKSALDRINSESRDKLKTEADALSFKSAHFNARNVLAHVRFNQRTSIDGKRILFLEEIQSDWAQTGKKIGFNIQPKQVPGIILEEKKAINERMNIAQPEYTKLLNLADYLRSTIHSNYVETNWKIKILSEMSYADRVAEINKKHKEQLEGFEIDAAEKTNNRQVEFYEHLKETENRIYESQLENAKAELNYGQYNEDNSNWHKITSLQVQAGEPTVPDMPFKQTSQWTSLAVRRMIRYAAEKGFQGIAWTTGAQQSERYSLSTQVSLVSLSKNKGGKYNLVIEGLDGQELSDYRGAGKEVAANELEDHVGKEYAKALIKGADENYGKPWAKSSKVNPEFYTIKTKDFKVGGQGMSSFYDSILPNVANKIGKKYGAKVGTTSFEEIGKVHSLDITDSMEESIMDGVPMFHAASRGKTPRSQKIVSKAGGKLKMMFSDRMLPLKYVQDEVLRRGGKIDTFSNAHSQENRSRSRSMARIDKLRAQFLEPVENSIVKIMKANRSVKFEDIEKYLIAKHAPERNAYYRDKNPDEDPEKIYAGGIILPKDHQIRIDYTAGELASKVTGNTTQEEFKEIQDAINERLDFDGIPLTDDMANAIAADYETKMSPENAKELSDNVRAHNKKVVDLYLEYGAISEDEHEELTTRWENYIPLRGWREDESGIFDWQQSHGGNSNLLKKAKGRISEADSPLAYMENMMMSAVVWGEENKIKLAMLNMVRNNYELRDGLFDMKKVWYIKTGILDPNTGEEKTVATTVKPDDSFFESNMVQTSVSNDYKRHLPDAMSQQREIEVVENGEKYIIVTTDPALANSVNHNNNMWQDAASVAQKTLGPVTRFMSSLMTSKNPAFIIPNLTRDFAYAWISNATDKQAIRFVGSMRRASGAIVRSMKGKAHPELYDGKTRNKYFYDKLYEDFISGGGRTGFLRSMELDKIRVEIEKDIAILSRPMTPRNTARKVGRFLNNTLDYMAGWSEDMSRFGTYIASIKAGKSETQAVNDAKDVTTNFDRKGQITSFLGAIFAFFNPAVQGGYNFVGLAKKNKTVITTASVSFYVLGYAMGALNRMMGGDDDDFGNYYEALNPYLRKNYLIIPTFWNDEDRHFISIPLPPVFRSFYGMGEELHDVMSGDMGKGEYAASCLGEFISSFSPFEPEQFIVKGGKVTVRPLVPTAMQPVFDAWVTGKDFTGNNIRNAGYTRKIDELVPNSMQGKKSTGQVYQWISDQLFIAGGGDPKVKSLLSIDDDGNVNKVPGILDWNPANIEYLFESYLGGRGQFFNQLIKTTDGIIDGAIKYTRGEQDGIFDEVDANMTPIMNRFIRKPWRSKNSAKYWDLKQRYDEIVNYEKAQFDSWIEENQERYPGLDVSKPKDRKTLKTHFAADVHLNINEEFMGEMKEVTKELKEVTDEDDRLSIQRKMADKYFDKIIKQK